MLRPPGSPEYPCWRTCSWTWRSIASETNSLGSPAPVAPVGIFLSPHPGRARGAREARAVPAARLLGGRPYHPRLPAPLESHQSQTSATPPARPGGASGRGVRMGEHFPGPASTAPSTHFLQERERGSQARRYLQICSASNHSHNIPQFTVPPAGPFRPSPRDPRDLTKTPRHRRLRVPHVTPRGKTRCFPKQNQVSGLGSLAPPTLALHLEAPTLIQLERGSQEVSPQVFAHAGSGRLHSPLSRV